MTLGATSVCEVFCIFYFVFCVCAGVGVGDRVAIYMPMILELTIAMLACARIGVIHSIVVRCIF